LRGSSSGVPGGQVVPLRSAVPLFGSSGPPSSSVATHWVSLRCWLSARSPVMIALTIEARFPLPCLTGLTPKAFICRIAQSVRCATKASCGRQAEIVAPEGSWSTNSTRAGDSSSASWKSVIWPK
jgi:hypothetical protein